MTDLTAMRPLGALPTAPTHGTASRGTHDEAKVKKTAKQFEAMFMTEMVHFARPQPKANGPFATGDGEKTWGMFMDQALGTAAADGLGSGLDQAIQNTIRSAQVKRK